MQCEKAIVDIKAIESQLWIVWQDKSSKDDMFLRLDHWKKQRSVHRIESRPSKVLLLCYLLRYYTPHAAYFRSFYHHGLWQQLNRSYNSRAGISHVIIAWNLLQPNEVHQDHHYQSTRWTSQLKASLWLLFKAWVRSKHTNLSKSRTIGLNKYHAVHISILPKYS